MSKSFNNLWFRIQCKLKVIFTNMSSLLNWLFTSLAACNFIILCVCARPCMDASLTGCVTDWALWDYAKHSVKQSWQSRQTWPLPSLSPHLKEWLISAAEHLKCGSFPLPLKVEGNFHLYQHRGSISFLLKRWIQN